MKSEKEIEREVIGAFVDSALNAGYCLSVGNAKCSTDKEQIMQEMRDGDDCIIYVKELPTEEQEYKGKTIGWVFCVFGNNGWDVIHDYTNNLEHLMVNAQLISDSY